MKLPQPRPILALTRPIEYVSRGPPGRREHTEGQVSGQGPNHGQRKSNRLDLRGTANTPDGGEVPG